MVACRRRRPGRRGLALSGLAAALLLSGCGGAGGSAPPRAAAARDAHTTGASAPARPRGHGSRGADPSASRPLPTRTPAAPALTRALDRELGKAGPSAGAVVYDLTAHRLLYSRRGEIEQPPASLEKLYTTAALLRTLGPAARLQTQVLGRGRLDARGTWHGDLYLKGGGDPTFGDGAFNQTWDLGYGPTAAQLAGQLIGRGVRRVTGRLIADESLFDRHRGGLSTSLAPDLPDLGGELSALTYDHGAAIKSPSPAAFAAQQLAATLRASHVRVRSSRVTAVTPIGAQPLASVSSPPLQIMLRLMDVPSDDLFAELLTKQLGVRFADGTGSIAAGAEVISHTIASDYGVSPRILDGSGLSRGDRSSPAQVVELLRRLWQTPAGDVLYASLPVVGVSGTVRGLALKTAAVGRCATKTGTLDAVSNLAGYCHSRGRHALAFALFVDGPPNFVAIPLIGQMVAAIARY